MQALGNDFLIVEGSSIRAGEDLGALARRLCDRHYGPGADGLVVFESGVEVAVDCTSRIFNADGGEAEVSGNGTRCLAAYLGTVGRWSGHRDDVRIGTAAGVKIVRRTASSDGRDLFEMEMGEPRLGSRDIPMSVEPALDRVVAFPLDVDGTMRRVTALSVGNPHCTLFVDEIGDVQGDPVATIGPIVEHHRAFPNRVNVEFVTVRAPNRIGVRFWERGVGATLSSGTGSTAASIASILNGRVESRELVVETPAGELEFVWRADGVAMLAGPAELVYTGVWRG